MKAILVWSDRTNMKYSLFDDKDGISGYERAVEAMYKEFDIYNQKNIIPNPYVYKGNDYCYFEANGVVLFNRYWRPADSGKTAGESR